MFCPPPPPPPPDTADDNIIAASAAAGANGDGDAGAPGPGNKKLTEAALSRSPPLLGFNEAVLRATEAALRSAGGGPESPPRPIGLGLPDTVAGAAAAKVGGLLFGHWRGGGGGVLRASVI